MLLGVELDAPTVAVACVAFMRGSGRLAAALALYYAPAPAPPVRATRAYSRRYKRMLFAMISLENPKGLSGLRAPSEPHRLARRGCTYTFARGWL